MKFSWDKDKMAGPTLVLAADTPTFDKTIIQHFTEEGFEVTYMPFTGNAKSFRYELAHLADPLELGERYAIVGSLCRLATPCFVFYCQRQWTEP